MNRKITPQEQISSFVKHLESKGTWAGDEGRNLWLYWRGRYIDGEQRARALMEKYARARAWRPFDSYKSEAIAALRDHNPIKALAFNEKLGDYLPVKNGLLNLETLELEEYSPKVRFTFQLPYEYKPRAKCPTIDKFLSDVVMTTDKDLILEFAAYLFMKHCLRKFLTAAGPRASGKSTLANLLAELVGQENYSSLTLQQLASGERFYASQLFGKLLNCASDIPHEPVRYLATIKALTGNDPIEAQFKYKDPFKFINTAKLLFTANELPYIEGDPAFWDRVMIVHFPTIIEPQKRDPSLLARMRPELPGFLNEVLEARARLLARRRFDWSLEPEEVCEMWNSFCGGDRQRAKGLIQAGESVAEVYRLYPEIPERTLYDWQKKVGGAAKDREAQEGQGDEEGRDEEEEALE